MRACGTLIASVGLLAACAVADDGSIVCLRQTGTDRIEAISPDGARRVVRVESSHYWGEPGLAVSPDGRRVAVLRQSPRALCVLEPRRPLRHLDLHWPFPHDQWEPPWFTGGPAWTPDGTALVFICSGTSVWATDADGSRLRMLVKGEELAGAVTRPLCFDLEGRLLVERHGGARVAIDVGSGQITELNLSDAEAEALWALHPVRSPRRSRVAYRWAGDVWILREGGRAANLTGGRFGEVEPLFWAPSDEAMVCRSPSGKVWEVPLDPAEQPRLLTRRAVPEAQVSNGIVSTVWTAVPVDDWLPPPGPTPPAVVHVTSEPSGADVFIDGHYKGRTALHAQILSVREMTEHHTVAVVKDNLQGVATDVLACQAQSQDLHVKLLEPLTDSRWPPEVAHVRNQVRRAIIHKSPKLLGQFSAPEVIFEDESAVEGRARECSRFRGRLPFPEAVEFLFGDFRTDMLHERQYYHSPEVEGDMGWHLSSGACGSSLSIEKRDGKWCITRLWRFMSDQ